MSGCCKCVRCQNSYQGQHMGIWRGPRKKRVRCFPVQQANHYQCPADFSTYPQSGVYYLIDNVKK